MEADPSYLMWHNKLELDWTFLIPWYQVPKLNMWLKAGTSLFPRPLDLVSSLYALVPVT